MSKVLSSKGINVANFQRKKFKSMFFNEENEPAQSGDAIILN
jgi:hypothetical protein